MNNLSPEQAALTPDEIPVDWNASEVAQPRDVLKETGQDKFFEGVISQVFAGADVRDIGAHKATNNLQLSMMLRCVDGAGKLAGPPAYLYVTLPTPNPAAAGHKPYASKEEYQKLYRRAREFIRAIGGELPASPVKADKGVYKDPETGAILDEKTKRTMFEAVDDAARRTLATWYNQIKKQEPCALKEAKLFFNTYRPTNSTKTKVGWLRYDSDGVEIIREDFAMPAEALTS